MTDDTTKAPDEKGAKTPEELAEEYCDRPRCATITRNDKTWHRMKAAYLAGYREGEKKREEQVDRLKHLVLEREREVERLTKERDELKKDYDGCMWHVNRVADDSLAYKKEADTLRAQCAELVKALEWADRHLPKDCPFDCFYEGKHPGCDYHRAVGEFRANLQAFRERGGKNG